MNIDKELQEIRRRLNETNLTFVEIAKRAGVSTKTVSRIAGGIESNPRVRTAQMINDALGDETQ